MGSPERATDSWLRTVLHTCLLDPEVRHLLDHSSRQRLS